MCNVTENSETCVYVCLDHRNQILKAKNNSKPNNAQIYMD